MTLDLMFVVVISSLAFGFQPLTAIMIIALALLDDIPIMTIAYDNTVVSPKPVRWDMHRIVFFSSLMGLMAVLQSFGLLWAGMYWSADPQLSSIAALTIRSCKPRSSCSSRLAAICSCSWCARLTRSSVRPIQAGSFAGYGRHADCGGADVRLRHPRA